MERIIPDTMTGTTNATYEAGLTSIVNYITKTKGAYAIVDAHNYARYNGNVITVFLPFFLFPSFPILLHLYHFSCFPIFEKT